MRVLAVVCLGALGCEEDVINTSRADTGVITQDGGVLEPLALLPGMSFKYTAFVTQRAQDAQTERTTQFELTLTIETVNDTLGVGPSGLTFSAVGRNLAVDDWEATADFDSWIARLGPTLGIDQVGGDDVSVDLSQPPQIPPARSPQGKPLPVNGGFFLDLRATENLRTAFAARYESQQPQIVDPATNPTGMRWRFAFSGADPSIFYYPDAQKTRALALEYDPRGFLVRLEESIGSSERRPHATGRLMLTEGP